MQNIIGYAETRLETIDRTGFSPVDSLILSEIAYLKPDGLVPHTGGGAVRLGDIVKAEFFDEMLPVMPDREHNRQLIYRLAASPRFRDIRMSCYEDKYDREAERQFAAVTYHLPDGTDYVAFRGTDTTITGWKEDFSMAYVCPVPAQTDGVDYLNAVGALSDRPLRVGGHSKGGNIAVYAAMFCSEAVRQRITDVYTHDGPGFREEIINGPEFANINERIRKTVPQSSLIGMLLQSQERFDIVKSRYFWILQHDPFSWCVDGDDFVYTENQSKSSGYFSNTLNSWVAGMTDSEREAFVDTIYSVISSTGAETFEELAADWKHHTRTIFLAMKDLDKNTKKQATLLMRELAVLALKNLKPVIEPQKLLPKRLRPQDTKEASVKA